MNLLTFCLSSMISTELWFILLTNLSKTVTILFTIWILKPVKAWYTKWFRSWSNRILQFLLSSLRNLSCIPNSNRYFVWVLTMQWIMNSKLSVNIYSWIWKRRKCYFYEDRRSLCLGFHFICFKQRFACDLISLGGTWIMLLFMAVHRTMWLAFSASVSLCGSPWGSPNPSELYRMGRHWLHIM